MSSCWDFQEKFPNTPIVSSQGQGHGSNTETGYSRGQESFRLFSLIILRKPPSSLPRGSACCPSFAWPLQASDNQRKGDLASGTFQSKLQGLLGSIPVSFLSTLFYSEFIALTRDTAKAYEGRKENYVYYILLQKAGKHSIF